jgi:hypothetical protein
MQNSRTYKKRAAGGGQAPAWKACGFSVLRNDACPRAGDTLCGFDR